MKIPKFIDTSKRRLTVAGSITAILLLFVLSFAKQFLCVSFKYGALLWAAAILFCFVIGFLYLLKPIKNEKLQKFLPWLLSGLMPFITITMTECLNGVFVYNMYYHAFIYGYILVLLVTGLIFAFTGNLKASIIVTNSIMYILALANYYVKLFRGTPFLPIDFASIGTAKNVAGTYDYTPSYNIVASTVMLILIVVISLHIKTPSYKTITKAITRSSFFVAFAAVITIFFTTNAFAKINLVPDFWNQTRGYKNTGVVLSFFLNLKYVYVSAPSGYNADKVDDIVYNYLKQEPAELTIDTDGDGIADAPETDNQQEQAKKPSKTPDIICIMNESFSDLSTVGEFTTNIDYLPFYRSLTDNTIKGNLIVPVIGSGTSNTEFEFLTGCSMSFYPSGSNAYTLYLKNKMPSLVSVLNQNKYQNLAFHPYFANGWNRPNVYNYFGFSRFDSIESVIDAEILSRTNGMGKDALINAVNEAYGEGNNKLIRQYVSDECNYDYVIEQYKKRDKSDPFFLFNVTMQNHGSYGGEYTNFTEEVYATGLSKEYPKANQYLSLIKKSDDAFKDLIKYFKKQRNPVIICMFGDHQPSIEQGFFEEIMGKSRYSLTTAEELELYSAPFCIWANFDIEESYIEKLSSNYLSSLLMQVAGVEMPPYNQYMLKLSKTLPVITNAGYMDSIYNAYSWSSSSSYSSLIKDYERVQYNYLFDTKNRIDKLYNVQ